MSDRPDPGRPHDAAFWDERHASHDPIESSEPDPTLVAEVTGSSPGRALDIATGDGRNAIWLASRGWRVTAVDFSGVALDRARRSARLAGVDVDWHQADLLEWSPPARAFDLVCVLFLHLPSTARGKVYARAAEAVRPGGTLLVVGHDLSNLSEGAGGPRDPDVLLTPASVVADLRGFSIVRAEVVRRPGAPERGPLDAVVCAVRDRA